MLLAEGLITAKQLDAALQKKGEENSFLGRALVELEYITVEALEEFLVRQCSIPLIQLAEYEIRDTVKDLLPYDVCRRYGVLPIDKLGSIMTVAMVDPLDTEALEQIRACSELKIKPILCNWQHFEIVLPLVFPKEAKQKKRAAAQKQTEPVEEQVEPQPEPKPAPKAKREPKPVAPEPEPEPEPEPPAATVEPEPAAAAEPKPAKEEPRIEVVTEATSEEAAQVDDASPDKSNRIDQLRSASARGVSAMTQAMAPVLGKLKTGADRAQQPRFGEEDLPIPEYTFDSFVVGTANAFTYAVAESVSDTPGAEYNPLFIYGDVGLGKTHLLNAIGISILLVRPNAKVSYLSSSAFGSKLVDAIQRHELDAFRERYSDREVLIIDDIQFLAGRERAQEEFFNIFNDLYNNHKQIVIAGDKEPEALDNLERRLVSRFAGGIVSGLKPPEWDMRIEILRRELARANATVPNEVLTLIATQVTDDIRKLSGSLKKVIAFCQLSRQAVTVDLAQEILGHLFRDRDRASWARRP